VARVAEGPAAWIAAIAGIVGVALAVIALRPGLSSSGTAPCSFATPDLPGQETGSQSAQLLTPTGVTASTRSDPSAHGRFAIELRWRPNDDRATSYVALVRGRYEAPAPDGDDYAVSGDARVPGGGECGQWLRALGFQGPALFNGLLSHDTYCFQVWATDDDGATTVPSPSPLSMPICATVP